MRLTRFMLSIITLGSLVFALMVSPVIADAELSTTLTPKSNYGRGWGITLGNPYIGVKYQPGSKFAYEIRVASAFSGVNIYSARLYRYITAVGPFLTLAGLEGGVISFNKEPLEGSGFFGLLFAGIEYPILKKLALTLDVGPAYISVSSGGVSSGGIEWVYNLGLYYDL